MDPQRREFIPLKDAEEHMKTFTPAQKKLFTKWQGMCRILLTHKFRYYMRARPMISDYEFDLLEKNWIALGLKIGRTRTPPFWVGFDHNHPWAHEVQASVDREIVD